jgi:hypothetical protein
MATTNKENAIAPFANQSAYDFDVSGITEANAQEMQRLKEAAVANGTFMTAPNGKPTSLNERQWLQVRTKAFKKWFGDWENLKEIASKIIDANGEPLPVAHSTDAKFTTFKNVQENDSGWLGAGHYFFGDRSLDGQYGKNVVETFLNVRNPYYASDEDVNRLSALNNNAESQYFAKEVQGEGYDGVYYNGNLNQEIVVFSPSQIKSTAMNNGNFDSQSSDIRYLFVGEQGAANLDKTEEATIRMDNLRVARQMETSGKEAKNIKFATGWERGADGKWRYETSDFDFAQYKDLEPFYSAEFDVRNNGIYLHEILKGGKNDPLIKMYPKFEHTRVKVGAIEFGGARWDDASNQIVFNDMYRGQAAVKSSLIHEIQHAIQRMEGFALGDNPHREVVVHNKEMHTKWTDTQTAIRYLKNFGKSKDAIVYNNFLSDFTKEQLKSVSRYSIENAIEKLQKQADNFESKANISSEIGYEAYMKSAGEVEARNASHRMDMTAEERRASLAAETEDIARQDQLFLTDALVKQPSLQVADKNSHISDKSFTPITRNEAEALVSLLKKSGLAKEVVFGQEALKNVQHAQAEADRIGSLRLLNVGERIVLDGSEYLKVGSGSFAKVLRAKDGAEKQKPVASSSAIKAVNAELRKLEVAKVQEENRLEDEFVASSERYSEKQQYNINYRVALSKYLSESHRDVLREVDDKLVELRKEKQELMEAIEEQKKKAREQEHGGKRELSEKDVVAHLRDVNLRIAHAERSIPHCVSGSVAAPVVSTKDYFCDTETTFKPIMQYIQRRTEDEHGNVDYESNLQEMKSRWEAMKADTDRFLWEQSPKSDSEYLIDKKNDDIYRFSDHWGCVASCTWVAAFDGTTNEEFAQGICRTDYGIAVSNIKNFTRKKDSFGWTNPEYRDTMRSLLLEKLDIIEELVANSNSQTYLGKSAIQYLERSVIGPLFKELYTEASLPAEEHSKFIDKYNALDKTTQNQESLSYLYMRTSNGTIYGAVKDSVIYLDDTRLNANTPIHEFAHLWNDLVKKDNPVLWAKIVDAVKETPYFKEVSNNPAYANLSSEARADEAFARAVGDEGARVFHDPSLGNTFKERFKGLLKAFWQCVGDKLGIRDLAPAQISRLSFGQLVKGATADITSGIPVKIGNHKLTAEQREQLLKGEAVQLGSLVDKSGTLHANVQIKLNTNNNKVEMSKIKPETPKPQFKPTLKPISRHM